jgi:hypothetical protein
MKNALLIIAILACISAGALAQSPPASINPSGVSTANENPDQPPMDEASVSSAGTSKLDLADFLSTPTLWDLSPSDYIERSGEGLARGTFTDELVSGYIKNHDMITFSRQRLAECVFRLENNKLKNIYLLFDYSESEKDLERIAATHASLQTEIAADLRSPGTPLNFTFPDKRTIQITEWNGSAARIRLYCNAQSSDGAYCSALIERLDVPDTDMTQRLSAKKGYFDAHFSAAAADAADRIVDIPMRHQLPGIGACWSATLTRQMDFLGSEIEPQMMAQMVQGNEDKLLQETGVKLGIYAKRYSFFTKQAARENAVSLLKEYNALAAAAGADAINYRDDGRKLVYGDNFINMDNSVLAQIAIADAEKYALFRDVVIAAINHGLPVGWEVQRWAPLVNIKAPGHRRMIVGYDLKRDQLVFSDSWGLKYERRTMSFRAGYAMTVRLEIICPDWIPATEFPADLAIK